MPLLEFTGFLLLLAAIVWLASRASRALGLRIPPDEDVDDAASAEDAANPEEQRWLEELAVLKLEERHPVC